MRTSTILTIMIVVVIAVAIVWWAWSMGKPAGSQVPAASQNQTQSQTSPATPSNYTINTGTTTGLGSFLTDGRGMTLYSFANDTIGASNCTGACLDSWTIFNVDSVVIPPGLDAGDFGSITRSDGLKQTTYYGWPLYRYSMDANSGDTLGDGLGGLWYVAAQPFYTVMLANLAATGSYLVDSRGKSLYVFASDTPGNGTVPAASKCSGTCIATWPPFYVGGVIVPSFAKPADFTSVTRADGKKQLAYKGYPLYYYSGDANPGDVKGNEINNLWYLAAPAGYAKPAAQIPASPVLQNSGSQNNPSQNYPISGAGGY